MSAFIQKVLPEAMTNYRLHLALIKSYMLDTRSAAKYPIDSELRTIKDMNYVRANGLYRLTKDTRNYSNPEDTSNQYWYEPSKDTTGMPSRSVAYAYIISLTSDYIKQYILIGAEGHVNISTRLGHKTEEGVTWSKWRPYSDRNPSYEMLQNTTGKSNTNYISFGNHELALPDARECDLGTVIRLDQWKGKGRVYSVEGDTDENGRLTGYHEKDTVSTEPVLIEYGSDLTFQINGTTITLTRTGMFDWSTDEYHLDTVLVNDKFHWSIYHGETELYRSEQCFDDALTPTDANYKIVRNGLVTDDDADINLSVSEPADTDDAIETCNTYEFEVFNDHEPYNSHFNYWVLFTYNDSKDSTAKLAKLYKQSLDDLKQDIENIHERITSEVLVLDSRITQVSGDLSTYVDRTIYDHDHDPTAHQYILNLIATISTGGGQAQSLAQHLIDPHAHENRFAPFSSRVDAAETRINYVSTHLNVVSAQMINYIDYTSADISDYVAKLSGNVYNDIANISNQYVTISNSINELSNGIYVSMASCCENITNLIYTVSHDLSSYVDVTSQSITDYVLQLSNVVSSLQLDDSIISLIYIVSRDLSTYVDTTSVVITDYIDLVSQNTSTYIAETSSGLSSYTDQVSDYVNIVSVNLSNYVDVTSQSITDYVTQLSWVVDHMEAGITSVVVASGLESSVSEDGHTVYISGIPATASDYGMVVLTSTVVLLDNLHVSDQYTVPNTNAVYEALQQLSSIVVFVSGDLSTYVDTTSWSIADYLYKFSSSIYEYINVVDSGLIEVSGHSGIYVDVTSDNRSAHISGLPASETEYGMVYAMTSIGPIADDVISKDYMVPTVEAVLNLGDSINNQITIVNQNLSQYVDETSGSISTAIYVINSEFSSYVEETKTSVTSYINDISADITISMVSCCDHLTSLIYVVSSELSDYVDNKNISTISYINQTSTDISNSIDNVSASLSKYVDVTSSAIIDYVNSLSSNIYLDMTSCCENMTSLIYVVSHDLSSYIDTTSNGLSEYITTVSGNLSTYVDTVSQEIIDYIDGLPQVDPGVVSVYTGSGLSGYTTVDGHSVYISGVSATDTTYGMVYTHETLNLITDGTSGHAVPTVNAVSRAIATTSSDISQYISILSNNIYEHVSNVSSNLTDHIQTVSGELSTFVRDVSGEIIEYINGLPQVDPGVISTYVYSGLVGTTTNDGHYVHVSGIPATLTEYGMVIAYDKIETITGDSANYTVPTVNAISTAIANVSGDLSTYIDTVSSNITTTINQTSSDLKDYVDTTSSELKDYVDTTSNEIIEYVNSLSFVINEDMTSCCDKMTSLIYTVSQDLVSYVVLVSGGLETFISTVSGDISNHITIVSGGISTRITEVSGDLKTYVDETSNAIIDYIDHLPPVDPGVVSVYVSSGLYGSTTENGHSVYISGLPTDATSYGMVKSIETITYINDPSSTYVVPTVNAVSTFVYSVSNGLYTYINQVSKDVSTTIYSVSQEITNRIDDLDFGITEVKAISGLIVDNSTGPVVTVSGLPATMTSYGMVFTYNEIAWITGPAGEHTVPTVNAVSEFVFGISHGLYNHITTVSKNISETIYLISQNITNRIDNLNLGISEVKAISGLIVDDSDGPVVTVSGLPASKTSYGMVYIDTVIETITDSTSDKIAPTVNAVSEFVTAVSTGLYNYINSVSGNISTYINQVSGDLHDDIYSVSADISNYISILDFGIDEVKATSGLIVDNSEGPIVTISGLPATMTSYGMVVAYTEVVPITGPVATFTVPTNNAVVEYVSTMVGYVSDIFGTYTSRVFGQTPIYTSRSGNDYLVTLAIDSTYYSGIRVSTVTLADGSTYIMANAQQPDAGNLLGTVKTQSNLNKVTGTSSNYTVPTVNAVVNALGSVVHDINGIEPVYVATNGTAASVGIHYTDEATNGVRLTGKIDGTEVYLKAEAETANGGTQIGTVKTIETITYIDDSSSAFVVPTVNAVSIGIANISSTLVQFVSNVISTVSTNFGTYTSSIYGVAPIYTSRSGNSYQVELKHNDNYYGGVRTSVVVYDNISYLMANAQQPDAQDLVGTVKTVDQVVWITGDSKYFVVPTVNAVSLAITSALYAYPLATSNTYGAVTINQVTSIVDDRIGPYIDFNLTSFTSMLEGYVPWSSIVTQENHPDVWAFTLGADMYIYGSNELLYNYNNPTDGTGWNLDAGFTRDNFGVVITWDKISRIDVELNEPHPVVPGADKTINLVGNPGDKFVVPTVNAVYDALMALSAQIPVITSQYIYIVSEVHTENHIYDYHTDVYSTSNYFINQVSEIHNHITQSSTINVTYNITSNYYNLISARNGISAIVDGSIVNLYGVPASLSDIGVVFTYNDIEWITGPVGQHTVPTVNAVSKFGYNISSGLSTYVKEVSSEIIEYINGIPPVDPGVVSVYVHSGLTGTTTNNGHYVDVSGVPGTSDNYGMVLVHNQITTVTTPGAEYTVPTVNAVSMFVFGVSNGLYTYTTLVSGELSTFVREVSSEIIEYIDGLPQVDPGVVSVHVNSGLYGSTTADGHDVYISGLPATMTSYGMVVAYTEVTKITGPAAVFTVPTNNAVVEYISDTVSYISSVFGTYTSGVYGQAPIYTSRSGNDYLVQLAIDSTLRGGTLASTVTLNGSTYLIAATEQPDAATKIGTVKTQNNLNKVTGTSANYTVPTVNAVSYALASIVPSVGGAEPIYTIINGTNVTVNLRYSDEAKNGVHLTGSVSGTEITLKAEAETANGGTQIGTVKTIETITYITDTSSAFVVPTVNAVSTFVYDVSNGLYQYIKLVSGDLSTYIKNVSSELYDEIYVVSGNITNYIGGLDFGVTSMSAVSGLTVDTTTGPTIIVSGLPATMTSYGMVIAYTEVTNITGPIAEFTVPTNNAVVDYVTSKINYISSIFGTYTSTVSGVAPVYVSRSGNNYQVKLAIDSTNYGGVLVSTLETGASTYLMASAQQPDAATKLGTVKTQNNLTKVTGISSNYTVPTVNAVSAAIASIVPSVSGIEPIYTVVNGTNVSVNLRYSDEVRNGVHLTGSVDGTQVTLKAEAETANGGTQIGTVKTIETITYINATSSAFVVPTVNAVSAFVFDVSRGLYSYISNVSHDLYDEIYLVSADINNRIENLNFGITEVKAISGLTVDDSDGPVVTVSGLPATMTSYGMVIAYTEVANITGPAAEFTVPTNNAVVEYISNTVSYISSVFGTYTSRVFGQVPIYTSRSGNDYLVEVAVDSSFYSGVMVSTVTLEDGSTYLMAAGGQPDALTSYGTVKTSDTLTRVIDTTSNHTVPTVNAVIDGIGLVSSVFNTYTSKIVGVAPIYTSRSGNNYQVKLAIDSTFHNGVRVSTITLNGSVYLTADANLDIPDPDKYGFVKYSEINTSTYNGIRLVAGTNSLSAYGSIITNTTTAAGLNGDFGMIKTINTVPTAPLNVTASYLGPNGATSTLAAAADKCIVPTINAVINAIGAVSTTFKNHVSTVSGIAPVYTSKYNNSIDVWVAHNDDYHGGARISTITSNGSTYIMAEAQQPNAAALVGTVKTQDNLVWVNDTSRVYTVPTVNAVSLAIVEAIYSPSSIYNLNFTSNTYYEIGSRYVPWEAVADIQGMGAYAFNLGAHFVKYKPDINNETTWHLYALNDHADGEGWKGATHDNFGVVITWDKISRINVNVNQHIPIVNDAGYPGTLPGVDFVGNPGDQYVVPTVNAVYDALQALSALIPEITSQVIYIVSEVHTENHIYDYHTNVYSTSNYYINQVSEIHNHITQSSTINNTYNITSNFYNLISAHNGISAIVDGSIVNLYGVPATLTDIGVVFVYNDIEWITGPVGQHTVPTVNAVSKFGYRISSSLSAYVKEVSADISTYIDGLNFGVTQVNAISGLIVDDSGGPVVTVSGLHATETSYGMVFVHNAITTVTTPEAGYTVPTVNAVSKFVFGVSNGLYQYIKLVSGDLSTYIRDVSGELYNIANYVTTLNVGVTSMSAVSGLTVDTTTGPTVVVTGLPATLTSYGMVIAYTEVAKITGPTAEFTVPTNNAVVEYISDIVSVVSTVFGTYTSRVVGVAPIYTSRSGNDYQVKLAIDSSLYGGAMISTVTSGGSTYLMASAQQPDAATKIGTVKTQNTLDKVTGTSANFTVPTVNAVSYVIAHLEIPDPEDYGYVKYTEVNTNTYNGVRLVVGTNSLSAYGSVVQTTTTNAGANGDFGVVKTINTIPTAPLTVAATYIGTNSINSSLANAADKCIVPTVNAVINGIGSVSTIFGKYTSSVSGIAPIYTAKKDNSAGVWLAHNDDYRGGVRLSTITANTSTYLVADARQPDAGANIGTVKTQNNLVYVNGTSYVYTVPTVNAVSKAIYEAIYAPSNIYNINIASSIYYEIGSSYVPWVAVIDEAKENPLAFKGGAHFYIYGDNDELHCYNDIGDGAGWVNAQYDNFGTVITWDRVSRINLNIADLRPVVPGDANGGKIGLQGNPGDKFVVPTVNAVYDALMALSAQIPTITSQYIYVVSEVHVENHNYDYHTETYPTTNSYITQVSEFHVNQIMNLNAYSGLSAVKANSSTYNISGLPASITSYGMVFVNTEVAKLTGPAAVYTVPTINAVYDAIQNVSKAYIPWSRVANADDTEYHDYIRDFGARLYVDKFMNGTTVGEYRKLFAYNELAIGVDTFTNGIADYNDWFGVVLPVHQVQRIENTINESFPIDNANPSEYLQYMGNPGYDFVVPTVNAVADIISYVSQYAYKYTANNHTYYNAGFVEVHTGLDRVEGQVIVNGNIYYNEDHVVPSINVLCTVSKDLYDYAAAVSNAIRAHAADTTMHGKTIYGAYNPIYINSTANPPAFALRYSDDVERGVRLGVLNNMLKVSGVPAQFVTVNNTTTWSLGVVKAYNGVSFIATNLKTDGTYYDYQYTVPTLNALASVSASLSTHVADAAAHAGATYNFDTTPYQGVYVTETNKTVSAVGVPASFSTATQTTNGYTLGVVRTLDTITYIPTTQSVHANRPLYQYTVPTMNALVAVSKLLSTHIADNTMHSDTTYTFDTTTHNGVALVQNGSAISATGAVATYGNNTSSVGVVYTRNNIATSIAANTSEKYTVPTVNAVWELSKSFYNHQANTAIHGGGGGTYTGIAPIHVYDGEITVSKANTSQSGVVTTINSIISTYYDYVVPTAAAVWSALQHAGGGSGGAGMLFPNYGAAGDLTHNGRSISPSGSGPSGTASVSGCWLLISIVATGSAQGCVGVSINGTFIPLAGIRDAAITQIIPVPPGASWAVYNGGGSGVTVQVRVL